MEQVIADKSGINRSFASRSDLHLARKLWHMLTGLSFVFVHLFILKWTLKSWLIITIPITILAFTFDLLRLRSKKLNGIITKYFSLFMREHEKKSLSGMPFYALGCTLSILLFKEDVALLSIVFLIFADPISAFFGVLYGNDMIMKNKSWQGAFACFATCMFITLIYTPFMGATANTYTIFMFAVACGIIGSISELLSFIVDYNLAIPVASGFGITFLNYLFRIF